MAFMTPPPAEDASRAAIWPAVIRSRGILAAAPLLPLVDRDELALPRSDVDLARARDLLLGVGEKLLPLRDPSRRPRNREEDREGRRRHPDGLVDQPGVKVHVRIELALDEVVVLEGDPLELQGDVQQRVPSGDVEDLVGHSLDDLGARVVVLVNAVPETHQPLLALAFLDVL